MATTTDIEFSQDQRRAVDSDASAVVVAASAGSGKTEVIARRVERLLRADEGGSSRVLALSYTVKAADELRQRLDARLGDAVRRVDCETIHGFAHDLLRKNGSWIGLPPEPEVLTREEDRVELLARWLSAAGVQRDRDRLPGRLAEMDLARARNGDGGPLLSEWRAALSDAGAVDFAAMLDHAVELLALPATRRQLGRLYDHVIVDEAQNLTPVQCRLLTANIGPPPLEGLDVMLVGDDKQSIVGFSGADPELMERFAHEYTAEHFRLTANFRSARLIVAFGEKVAAQLDDACLPTDVVYPAEGAVELFEAVDEPAEAAFVASWVAGLLADGFDPEILVPGESPMLRPEHVAVLGRSAASLRATRLALNEHGIATAVAVRMEDWLTSRAGRVLLELLALRAADHRAPRWELARLLGVGEEVLPTLGSITAHLERQEDGLAPLAAVSELTDPAELVEALSSIAIEDDPEWEGDRHQLADAWERFILQTDRAARTWANFRIFTTRVQRASDLTSGVRLLTVHKAQGREYRAVAVVGMNDGQFPDFRADTVTDRRAEERAVYVAVTRPSRLLLLTRPCAWATRYGSFRSRTRATRRSPTHLALLVVRTGENPVVGVAAAAGPSGRIRAGTRGGAMADRLVTHAALNSRGNIVAVGNPDEDWRQRRREWAISDILAGRHDYFVAGTGGNNRPVDVVHGPFGPYLRTRADPTPDNNLDTIPSLDLEPWEVALDDAEVLAVHAALVPHGAQGQVLMFGGNEHDPGQAEGGEVHHTRVYEVDQNLIIDVASPDADVFCCDHAFLADGRLLVGGGTAAGGAFPAEEAHLGHQHWSGARECAVYNVDGTWSAVASMLPEPGHDSRGGGRWYPTLLTLGDGRILAVGGHPRVDSDDQAVNDTRHGAWLPESYDPVTDAWTYQPGHWLYVRWGEITSMPPAGQSQPPNDTPGNYLYYPRLFTLPDGRLFMASRNDGNCGWYDPVTGVVDEQTVGPPPHGGGFAETNHTAVLLPLMPGDDYTPRVLFLGLAGAHRIALEPDVPSPTWEPTAPRDWAPTVPPAPPLGCPARAERDWAAEPPLRRHGCATLLPTGDVLFTGGIDSTKGSGLPDCDGVLEGELYHPGFDWDTGVIDFQDEEWTTTHPASVVRNYHSVALLLPNGRVLTAGGNLNGQSGPDSAKERRIEVYCPAYDGAPNRPVISQAPASLSHGQTFQFTTSRADRVQRVALMRCGSVTHAWDGDQRYVGLEFANPAEGLIEAIAPPSGNVAPPGPYMLWVIDNLDRPCRLAPFLVLS